MRDRFYPRNENPGLLSISMQYRSNLNILLRKKYELVARIVLYMSMKELGKNVLQMAVRNFDTMGLCNSPPMIVSSVVCIYKAFCIFLNSRSYSVLILVVQLEHDYLV